MRRTVQGLYYPRLVVGSSRWFDPVQFTRIILLQQATSMPAVSNGSDHQRSTPCSDPMHSIAAGASLGWRASLMLCYVQVQESSNHLLILGVMFLGFALEEINAVFAQANRYLDLLFAKSKFGGGGEKIPDDFDLANGAISVCDFLAHGSFCLSANIRRRRCG